jgi:hypothetical protein
MGETYLEAIAHFAWRRSLVLTDRLSIIIGVLVPAIARVTGKPVAEDLASTLAWGAIIIVLGGVALRLITAPYFIWREQNKTIAELRAGLAAPEHSMKQAIHADIAAARIGLFEQLSRIHERFGKDSFSKEKYVESLRGETTGILAAKLQHDPAFKEAWAAHLALADRLHRFGTNIEWMQDEPKRELEQSHWDLLRIIQLK